VFRDQYFRAFLTSAFMGSGFGLAALDLAPERIHGSGTHVCGNNCPVGARR